MPMTNAGLVCFVLYNGMLIPVPVRKCPALGIVHNCKHLSSYVWPYPLLHVHGHELDVAFPVYVEFAGAFVHCDIPPMPAVVMVCTSPPASLPLPMFPKNVFVIVSYIP